MKKINKLLVSLLCMTLMFSVTACDDDDYDTNQIGKGTSLSSFGPNPVARGGELRFIGSNLNNIKQVEIPGCSAITTITVKQSGSPSEIAVIVPKDGPEVGYVTLTANDGTKITTETELTYTEPIALDSFSPSSIFPGEVLTIEGDYLNLIHEILFSTLEDNKYFSVADSFFISHDRYAITLEVPEEAVSGKIIISDADEDAPNWIYSEENLEVKTASAEKVESSTFKAGDQMTITGTRLDLVEYVRFYNAEGEAIDVAEKSENKAVSTEYFFTYSDGVITLAQPAEAASGTIVLVMRSEVEVIAMEDFVAVLPEVTVAEDATLKNSTAITISGDNLDIITSIAFPTIEEGVYSYVTPTLSDDGSLSFTIPSDAIDGEMLFVVASGESVAYEYELLKPTFTGFISNEPEDEPAPAKLSIKAYSANETVGAGESVIIEGTDLDLVAQISVGGGDFTDVSWDGTTATATLAVNSKSGEVVFVLVNGQEYDTEEEPEIAEVTYCYLMTDDLPDLVYYNEMMRYHAENQTALTDVILTAGEKDYELTFTFNDTLVFFLIPSAEDLDYATAATITLISGDESSPVYEVSMAEKGGETTLWRGLVDPGDWGGFSEFAYGAFDFEKCTWKAGNILTVYFTIDLSYDYWKLKFAIGDSWSPLPVEGAPDDGFFDLEADQESISLVLTDEILEILKDSNNGGLLFQTYGITITEVTIIQ